MIIFKYNCSLFRSIHRKVGRAFNLSVLVSLTLLTLCLCETEVAIAQPWVQKGLDIDGEAQWDLSGRAVCLSADGNSVAIGAGGNDGNGSLAGHVRVYEWSGSTWVQRGADIDGEAAGDSLGESLSFSDDGNTLAIGAPGNDDAGLDAGSVRIYQWNASAWIQKGNDLDGEAAEDKFGTSVRLNADGNTVIVGAPRNDANGTNAGHARIYDWNGTSWIQRGADINGQSSYDGSGRAVDINAVGNSVAIGAPWNDGNNFWSVGHVRVGNWNGAAWVQKGNDMDGSQNGSRFGSALSMSSDGNTIVIGAPWHGGANSLGKKNRGRVWIAQWNGSSWTSIGNYMIGEEDGDWFGYDVSISADGNRFAVGSPLNDGAAEQGGSVRIYEWQGAYYSQVGADIDGEFAYDYSGYSVSLSADGKTVAVGAPYNDAAGDWAGRVKIFTAPCTSLSEEVAAVCDSFTWIDGVTYYSSITGPIFSLTNAAGCDSFVTLNLTINPGSIDEVTACDSFTWRNGVTYTSDNNSATDTLTSSMGCDSVITLNLTFPEYYGTDIVSACDSFTWIDGITYTADNNFATYTLLNSEGCDSVVSLDLTITSINPSIAFSFGTLMAIQTGAAYQWLDCENGFAMIPGATNQNYTPTVNGTYAAEISFSNCADTSGCFNISSLGILESGIGDEISIYPNPFSELMQVDLGANYHDVNIRVKNLLGQTVYHHTYKTAQQEQFSIPGSSGIYFAEISISGVQVAVVKLVKEG